MTVFYKNSNGESYKVKKKEKNTHIKVHIASAKNSNRVCPFAVCYKQCKPYAYNHNCASTRILYG